MEVDTIDESHLAQVFVLDAEEILIIELLITIVEVLGQTRVLTLHQFLNASILSHIDVCLRARRIVKGIVVRSEQSMTDLMTDQHGVHSVACTIPQRESQDTLLNIEGSSGDLLVLHQQVLGSKQSCEVAFDFLGVVHRVSSVWIQYKTPWEISHRVCDGYSGVPRGSSSSGLMNWEATMSVASR